MLCGTVWHILQDTVVYIFNNTKGLTSSRICGIVFQGNGCSEDEPSLEWTVDVDLGPKPNNGTADSGKAAVRASMCSNVLIQTIKLTFLL
jgi:hypothetical protein